MYVHIFYSFEQITQEALRYVHIFYSFEQITQEALRLPLHWMI
jgi:hypothetical protein